ncbi:hypothetical protein V500_00727 [Pseudogymnoascus sp. VKM F-4518 (FW-2643)]|nr:hypothetical protein V500_00727 [Pseudogymnoascus sp. VKM F-4518 (FW-2643)]
MHDANRVGSSPDGDNMDLEITQVTTPEPSTTPRNEVDSMPLTASVASASSMQVQEVMVPALATRSTQAVIEDLRRRGLHPKEPTSDKESVADGVEEVFRSPEEEGAISEAIEDGDGGNETESDEEEPAHLSENQELSYEKTVRESYIRSRVLQANKVSTALETKDDDKQSVKWLIKDSGSQEIISSPREYQIELFERAKTQNIIAVLDTGSGKTLIAALLLRHVIDEELERRANGGDKRIAFFLVDSVALVFQQYAVLKCNLNQKMEQFCGDMGCDLWSKELWEKHLNENMVIVCTAEVLFQCLHHSFITMKQINLLIFDEAHHAKRNHAYARIIKDFYASEPDQSLLPRIFGMTASPVDARTNIKKGAAELEALLHSQIATASDASLLQYTNKKTKEELATYDPLPPSTESQLFKRVHQLVGGVKECSKPLEYAIMASSDLGSWVADQVLLISFTGEEVKKLEAKIESNFHKQAQIDPIPLGNLESRKERFQSAQQIIMAHVFASPQLSCSHLSSKVLGLAGYLRERFERTTFDKCIVFVRQRYTAKLLADLFARPQIGTPHLRVGSLTGTRNRNGTDLEASFRNQVITLRRFRQGEINCLFATSVAEEGLDIPDCNLVIRFDLYSTVIQYIQSRGRARQTNSSYIHFIEHGNKEQEALVREVRRNENILKEFCQALPEDRLLSGNNYNMDYFLAKERNIMRTYTEPSTGAKLTYRMSLSVLANFVASLPHSSESTPHPEYMMTAMGAKYVCEVILPENSPVHGAIGRPANTKQVAKCSAAFEACLKLRKGKHLDEYLLSTFKDRGPAMRNAHLAITSKANTDYDMRMKPSMWAAGEAPTELFLTILSLEDPDQLDRPSQPLGLLTRGPLPRIPQFQLFFGRGKHTAAVSTAVGGFGVNSDTLELINTFSLRVFKDIFSKEYESNPTKMPYFMVPISNTYAKGQTRLPADLISWDILKTVSDNQWLTWDESTPESFFEDKYILDPFDGSRKIWAMKVTHEYKPLDAVPPNTAARSARKNNSNILEYSCSLFKVARSRRTFSETQPVIEGEVIPFRRNFLDDHDDPATSGPTKCYVVPEPLTISALPTTIVAMAYTFPAIIHRIESYLIAVEACSMLHLPISADLALECMTKDSQNTDEHGEEQVEFQRGMGNNYERLEFLGDCFLKMATSISLYTLHPDSNEFDFHVKRMLMICNKNLMDVALQLKLYEFIRSQAFSRRAWYPEGLVLKKGKAAQAPKTHKLGDKTIADVSEALIGAALLTPSNGHAMDHAVRAVTELVCSTDHAIEKWEDYFKGYTKPKYQIAASTASQRNLAEQIEISHNYHFHYPRLLRSAFIHPSYPFAYERVPNYQRLEFLGDSLLDMACVNFLFHRFPAKDPQWLTEHKMAMVSNQFLGALCVKLEFHTQLLQFNPIIQSSIIEYVCEVTEARQQAEQDAIRDGKRASDCARDYWLHTKLPPKCLPDIIEAYIGAIFVDSSFNYGEVERFFDLHVKWYFEDVTLYDTFANKHPVTFLHKFLQQNMGCAKYRITASSMPDDSSGTPPKILATVMIHSQVLVGVERDSARYAKIAVAQQALEILKGGTLAGFRQTYRCDCKEKGLDVADCEMEEAAEESLEGHMGIQTLDMESEMGMDIGMESSRNGSISSA